MKRDLLYVDDEPDNIVVFEAAFEDDFRIWSATSGQQALEVLEQTPIPVVVSDQRMPAMTGVEMFSIMRRRYPHIQRIILTGYTDPEGMIDAINQGQVFHFVKKPWERPFLLSVLIRAFGWLALLSNRGLVNTWLAAAGLTSEPLSLVRNEFSVVVGMAHYLTPFAVFPIASSMRAVDERVLLAARGLGASRLRIFWTIFAPMTAPGAVGAALIVFVFALGFFITPAILGGGRSIMMAELVYVRMFQSPDWGLGAAISVALVVIVGLLIGLLFRFAKPALIGGAK